MENSIIKIEITKLSLKKMLSAMLNSPHKDIIAETIISNIEVKNNDLGLSNLFQAMHGIKSELKDYNLSIGDVVTVNLNRLYVYNLDKAAMQKLGIIIGKTIEATVINFDPTNRLPIEIKFVIINETGKKAVKKEYISFDYIIKPKKHEDINIMDDMPF